jgi:hypothetical protein
MFERHWAYVQDLESTSSPVPTGSSDFALPTDPYGQLKGFIQAPDRPVTLEEMDKAIAEGAAEGSATR